MGPVVTVLVVALLMIFVRFGRMLAKRICKIGRNRPRKKLLNARGEPCKCVAVLGSGGHTSELLQLIQDWDRNRWQHIFIATDEDPSNGKIKSTTTTTTTTGTPARLFLIKRSRRVGEGWVSSFVNTCSSCVQCIALWYRELSLLQDADLLLINGPGVCVPVVISALFWEAFGYGDLRIVFVESFCRTRRISMTGKMLQPVCDRFVVQWAGLADKKDGGGARGGGSEVAGRVGAGGAAGVLETRRGGKKAEVSCGAHVVNNIKQAAASVAGPSTSSNGSGGAATDGGGAVSRRATGSSESNYRPIDNVKAPRGSAREGGANPNAEQESGLALLWRKRICRTPREYVGTLL
eukprot:g14633.t1